MTSIFPLQMTLIRGEQIEHFCRVRINLPEFMYQEYECTAFIMQIHHEMWDWLIAEGEYDQSHQTVIVNTTPANFDELYGARLRNGNRRSVSLYRFIHPEDRVYNKVTNEYVAHPKIAFTEGGKRVINFSYHFYLSYIKENYWNGKNYRATCDSCRRNEVKFNFRNKMRLSQAPLNLEMPDEVLEEYMEVGRYM